MLYIKKFLPLGVASLGLILIGLAFFFWPKDEVSQVCNPYLNIEAIIKTGDLKSCDCLDNKLQIKQCQETITGAGSFTAAAQSSDLSSCENIIDIGMKAACIRITQGKIDFANKNSNLSTTSKQQ